MSDLLDASLVSDYDHDLIERMALAATLCIRRAPLFRPNISIVSIRPICSLLNMINLGLI